MSGREALPGRPARQRNAGRRQRLFIVAGPNDAEATDRQRRQRARQRSCSTAGPASRRSAAPCSSASTACAVGSSTSRTTETIASLPYASANSSASDGVIGVTTSQRALILQSQSKANQPAPALASAQPRTTSAEEHGRTVVAVARVVYYPAVELRATLSATGRTGRGQTGARVSERARARRCGRTARGPTHTLARARTRGAPATLP